MIKCYILYYVEYKFFCPTYFFCATPEQNMNLFVADGSYISSIRLIFVCSNQVVPPPGFLYYLYCTTYENLEVNINNMLGFCCP